MTPAIALTKAFCGAVMPGAASVKSGEGASITKPLGPGFIALQVRDLAASRKFYTEVFGFEAAAQHPPGAVVKLTAG
jgi:catechol-2,3-dioxygenase